MDDEKRFTCGTCGACFKRSDNLKKHLLIHTSARSFQCTLCDKAFRERSHLSSHILIHTGEKPYKCSYCHKAFNQNSNLKKHMKIHTDDRPYMCTICNNRFTQQCYLNEHMKNHTGVRDFECSQCGKKFKNCSHLKSHMKAHSDERPYRCSVCGKAFKYEKNYSAHMLTHDGNVTCHCIVCRKEFPNRNDLNIHMLVHSNVQVYECFVCGNAFRKVDDLRRHLQAHTGERPYKCTECEESFKSKTYLKFHLMLHSGEKPFSCEVCGCGFRTKSHLNSHMISHDIRRHSCVICGKSFKYKCNQTRHMKTHVKEEIQEHSTIRISTVMERSKRAYKEGIITSPKLGSLDNGVPTTHIDADNSVSCRNAEHKVQGGKSITVISIEPLNNVNFLNLKGTSSDLHHDGYKLAPRIKICTSDHSQEKLADCIIFDKAVGQGVQLDDQLQFQVTEQSSKYKEDSTELIYDTSLETYNNEHCEFPDITKFKEKCKFCGKQFSTKYFLKRHMLVHSKERPYECLVCDKKFKNKAVLNTHSVTHTGERRYSCNICDKKFIQKSDQKRHMRIHVKLHNREKPFSCDTCKLKFAYKHNLDTHKIIHAMKKEIHTDNDYKDNNQEIDLIMDENGQAKHIIQSIMSHFNTEDYVPDTQYDKTVTNNFTEERNGYIEMYSLKSFTQVPIDFEILDDTITETSGMSTKIAAPCRSFLCIICRKACPDSSSLKAHMRTHTLSCIECGRNFNRLNNLKRHMLIHTGERPFECTICKKRFTENGHLKTHMMLMHSSERPYQCHVCPKKFSLKSNHLRHLKIHDAETQNLQNCETVNVERLDEGLDLIMTNQIENSAEKCVITDGINKDTLDLSDCVNETEHCLFVGDNIDEVIHICTFCGKQFSKRSNLKRHLLTHTCERPYSCSCCEKSFKEKKCRDEHELTHTGVRPHLCMICNKTFTQKSVLKRHMKTHYINVGHMVDAVADEIAAENNVNVLIHEKDSQFQKPRVLREEISDMSDESLEPVVEVQVGKIAVQAITYEAGLKRKQLLRESKQHRCSICSRQFNRKGNLIRHMQCHKIFSCGVCNEEFKIKQHFDSHMSMHNQILLYQCDACGKTFRKNEDLQNHSRIHELANFQDVSTVSENTIPLLNDEYTESPPSQVHMENFNREKETLICSTCGIKFKFKHHLESHMLIHELRKKIELEKEVHHRIIVRSDDGKTKKIPKSSEEVGNSKNKKNNIIEQKRSTESNCWKGTTGELELGKITVKTIPYSVAMERRSMLRGHKN